MNAILLALALASQPPAPPPKALPSAQVPPPVTPVADDQVPPPRPVTPEPQTVNLKVESPPPAPIPAPAPQVQTIVLRVVAEPVQAPTPQTVTLNVTPTAPAPTPVASAPMINALVQRPGPIGKMIGNVGETLARAKMTKIYVPTQQAQVVTQPIQQVVYTPVQQVVTQQVTATPQVQPVLATPQAPRKGLFHHR